MQLQISVTLLLLHHHAYILLERKIWFILLLSALYFIYSLFSSKYILAAAFIYISVSWEGGEGRKLLGVVRDSYLVVTERNAKPGEEKHIHLGNEWHIGKPISLNASITVSKM